VRPALVPAVDHRLRQVQRFGGNRAAARALSRPTIQRCEKCTLLAEATAQKDPQRAHLLEYMQKVRKGDKEKAIAIAREWNQHHPDQPVSASDFRFILVKDSDLTPSSTGGGGTKTAADPGLVSLLIRFRRLLNEVIKAGTINAKGEWSDLAPPGADDLLKEISFLLGHDELINGEVVKGVAKRIRQLAEKLLQLQSPLQRLCLSKAKLLVQLGLRSAPSLKRCCELYPTDGGAQLKGLVGEFLGREAAKQHFAIKGGPVYDEELTSVCLIEITPRENYDGPFGGQHDHRSAPVLWMHGSQTHVGQVIGEVDTLLCQSSPGGLIVVGALESKGGNNDLDVVEKQTEKISGNLQKIGQSPATFCFARRVGNTYMNINGLFDLTSVQAKHKVHTTGPERKQSDRQFDIQIGMRPEEMDGLLRYLVTTPTRLWGVMPLQWIVDEIDDPQDSLIDLVLAARELPDDIMDRI
jgi:hypothetical protein